MNDIGVQNTAANQPLFSAGIVSRMTGISVDSLRAWERRYGFPKPARTSGGHRLFSERDIWLIQWIKGQIEQGVGTGAAIATARDLKPPSVPPVSTSLPDESVIRDLFPSLRERLSKATAGHETELANQILGEALAVSTPEQIILELIGPMLSELGHAWMEGRISIAEEHLWSHYFRQRLLLWMLSGPPAQRIRPIVLACAPGELHEGGLMMLGALLRRRRWPVAYLGQDLPLADLASFVRSVRSPLVVIAAVMESSARALSDWQRWFPTAPRPLVAFGGRAFVEQPSLQKEVPGLYLGDSIRQAVETLEPILGQTFVAHFLAKG